MLTLPLGPGFTRVSKAVACWCGSAFAKNGFAGLFFCVPKLVLAWAGLILQRSSHGAEVFTGAGL